MINLLSLETLDTLKAVIAILLAYLIIAGVAGAFQAWMAYKCGDDTAASVGMMTINPFVHVDPISLLIMPFGYLLFHVIMGLSRPVPILWHNFDMPWRKFKMALVVLAQPMAILIILVSMLFLQTLTMLGMGMAHALAWLPMEAQVYGYVMRALIGFSVWFIPYQLLMSLAQIYIYEQEVRGKEVNYTIILLIVPLFGAVLLLDISQWLLIHFLSIIESGIGVLVSTVATKIGV